MSAGPLPMAAGVIGIPPSGIRVLANAAAETPDALRLDLGQPDFPTPEKIREAGLAAIGRGFVPYTHTLGTPALREAVVQKLSRVNGLDAKVDGVACTSGGVGAITATMAAVLTARDEVLVPDPAWPNYRMIAAWLGARVVPYPCRSENGFEPDPDELATAITDRTRLIVINSPNSPTGAVYEPATLERIADIAASAGVWLLSDECYDQILFEDQASAPLAGRPGVAVVYSCSKTFAMTGWRLGYLYAEPALIESVAKVLESFSSCPSLVSQAAAEAALGGVAEASVTEMVTAYRRRRDLVAEPLEAAGVLLHRPEGAFYCMVDIGATGMSSMDYAMELLRQEQVSVAPGSAFGSTDAAVRLSLASSDKVLAEGVKRLLRFSESRQI